LIKTTKTMPTQDEIIKLILNHQDHVNKLLKYQDYYEGKHEILNRQVKDSTQGDNKLVNNYPSYITDVLTGYLLGKPVAYISTDEELSERLYDTLEYNDESSHNYELGKQASIKGSAYEILYTEENPIDGRVIVRFGKINPEELILAYDYTVAPEPMWAIRHYKVDDESYVELYTQSEIYYYKVKDGSLILSYVEEHFFDGVPIVEYANNAERQGDFEKVITLIDSYDLIQSNTANLFEYNDQALLKLINYSGTTAEEIREMKKSGAVKVETGGDVQWLLKDVNDVAAENHKANLRNDIHKFSKTPNLSDESFSGNLSGVAIEFKLWSTEQHAITKERSFKRGLQRRIELMCNFWAVQGVNFDWRDVKITFTRNMPINAVENVDTAIKMTALTSRRTAIAYLQAIDDVNAELELIEQEMEGIVIPKVGDEDEQGVSEVDGQVREQANEGAGEGLSGIT
jgi:SPP1 family phage portal protein